MGNIAFGGAGEQIAADFLLQAGYQLLARNYRAKTGEIDIIAQKNGTIAFVEVKTRSNYNFGSPAEAVTYIKQRKIISTALNYLKSSAGTDKPFRFDIIEVLLKPAPGAKAECNHIVNAFGN
ncbi:MAG: YraN family protein [Negativicutes bacterium]|nr:YraN family protein [Negativicutes bacterium]